MDEKEVLVVLDVAALIDRAAMEKHLRREGLVAVEGEPFAYRGSTTTDVDRTLLYVFDAVKKAIQKGGASECAMVVAVGEAMGSYRFDPQQDGFVPADGMGYNG